MDALLIIGSVMVLSAIVAGVIYLVAMLGAPEGPAVSSDLDRKDGRTHGPRRNPSA